ncbi:hypothetical protein QAD02_014622 [Eretmocerus hayati]|uniref:Uncharacterized protein n=1 Tax=Eretmocerus hayati TaxID=131215 RepID=A0ACC2P5H9_9HYME|nr:hypothetical protein QAD02_014622 [Eretmocerus hayati]
MGAWPVFRNFLFGLPAGIFFSTYVGTFAFVEGRSMQPTLNPDSENEDLVFLNRLVVRNRNIQRGDIVTFISPKYPHKIVIKRVIGLSGDVIHTLKYRDPILQVPDNYCWVEGDNPTLSLDSNSYGPIPLDTITAKATCILWPPSRWQSLNSFIPDSRISVESPSALAA